MLDHLVHPKTGARGTETPATKPRLPDQLRDRIRLKHYSMRTEKAYLDWVKRFIVFHGKRHPVEMGKAEVERFLSLSRRSLAAASLR